MPFRRFKRKAIYSRRRRPVRLPEPKQPMWKKMVGIGTQVADKLAMLPGPMGVAGRVLSGIGNLINVEQKYHDVAISTTFDSATGAVIPLTLIAQGTTDVTRNGNSIMADNISLKMKVFMSGSATLSNIRLILFIDKQNAQGTAPTIAQLLNTVSTEQHLNMNNSDRFVVLKSQAYAMVLVAETRQIVLDWFQDLSDLHVKYDGTAGDQASAAENHLYLAVLSSESTNTPTIQGFSRFRFIDN